ncbi:unnamed protein product [Amoebophrya sp. A120]|nr:unnamed protein product [Amoebophrya sp. A120]|eukprot:GSA120T00007177001.1
MACCVSPNKKGKQQDSGSDADSAQPPQLTRLPKPDGEVTSLTVEFGEHQSERSAGAFSNGIGGFSGSNNPPSTIRDSAALQAPSEASPISPREHNLFRSDPELKAVLEKLETVATGRAYRKLKGTFLERFAKLIEEKTSSASSAGATAKASKAHEQYGTKIHALNEKAKQLDDLKQKGDISGAKISVKGKSLLADVNPKIHELGAQLMVLMPTNTNAEAKCGYTKYHLLLELVKSSFSMYTEMKNAAEILENVQKIMDETAGKQLLSEIPGFQQQIERFSGVMADLGLFDFMLKAKQFANDEEEIIFIDPKTGMIGELSRAVLNKNNVDWTSAAAYPRKKLCNCKFVLQNMQQSYTCHARQP